MSNVILCDKCKEPFKPKDIKNYYVVKNKKMGDLPKKERFWCVMDLCKKCDKELKKWLG
jgi:ribosome biogenesis SPOUT family RNA methylase Rps3